MDNNIEYQINQIKVLDIIDNNGKEQYIIFKIYRDEKENLLIRIVNIFDNYHEADLFKNKILQITGIRLDLAEMGKFEICEISDFPSKTAKIKRFNINKDFIEKNDSIKGNMFSIIKMLSGMPIEIEEMKQEEVQEEINEETIELEENKSIESEDNKIIVRDFVEE